MEKFHEIVIEDQRGKDGSFKLTIDGKEIEGVKAYTIEGSAIHARPSVSFTLHAKKLTYRGVAPIPGIDGEGEDKPQSHQ